MRVEEGEPALVLRRTEYGDSDLILCLYCRNLGKVNALARGARRSKKRFGAGLGLFCLSEVSLSIKPKAQLWTLASAVPKQIFDALAMDVGAMAHGSYGIELLRELSVEENPDSVLFDLLYSLFVSLAEVGPKAGRLRVFELQLLTALGLSPVFDRCASCQSAALQSGAVLSPAAGGVLCKACAAYAREGGVRTATPGLLAFLQNAQTLESLEQGDALDSGEWAAQSVPGRSAMLAILYFQVGKPLKSVEFIAQLNRS